MKITLSKTKWESIGKKAGWMGKPKAPEEGEFGHGLSSEAMELLKQYDIRSNNMWKYNDFPDIQEGISKAKSGDIESLRNALEKRFGKKKPWHKVL